MNPQTILTPFKRNTFSGNTREGHTPCVWTYLAGRPYQGNILLILSEQNTLIMIKIKCKHGKKYKNEVMCVCGHVIILMK